MQIICMNSCYTHNYSCISIYYLRSKSTGNISIGTSFNSLDPPLPVRGETCVRVIREFVDEILSSLVTLSVSTSPFSPASKRLQKKNLARKAPIIYYSVSFSLRSSCKIVYPSETSPFTKFQYYINVRIIRACTIH